jgi:hypothetical protein
MSIGSVDEEDVEVLHDAVLSVTIAEELCAGDPKELDADATGGLEVGVGGQGAADKRTQAVRRGMAKTPTLRESGRSGASRASHA